MSKAIRLVIFLIVCFVIPFGLTVLLKGSKAALVVWMCTLLIIPLVHNTLLGKKDVEEANSQNDIT